MDDIELLYCDDEIRVEACLGPTETLVFSFNSYFGTDATDGNRFGYPFLPKSGFSAIYITARQNHWWQISDQKSFIAAVLERSARYRRRITYGSSMGGYGALLYAKELNATGAVAFVPQTVISNPQYKLHPKWREAIDRVKITKDDIIDTIGAVPDVQILYDPRHPMDRAFVDYIAGVADIEHYVFPFIGHGVPAFLAEAKIISEITAAMLNRTITPRDVRARSRAARLGSTMYLPILERRLAKRRHSKLRISITDCRS